MSKNYQQQGASIWSQIVVSCLLVGLGVGGYLFAKSDDGEVQVNLDLSLIHI